VVTALAAALSGWVAVRWWGQEGEALRAAVLLVSVAGSVLLATLLVRLPPDRGQAPEPDRERRPPRAAVVGQRTAELDRGRPPDLDGRSARPGADRTERETVQLVLPVGQPEGGAPRAGQWWDRGAPAPAAGTRAITPIRPAPRDLAELREAARVVQCPRCGAFRIDVRHTDTGYAFRCRVDGHGWTWQLGTAWPATVVASHRRKRPSTAGPH
jgi:hypothetical protein